MNIGRCRDDEREAILEIVNGAAEAYSGVIPADLWHEPYMPVSLWGYEADGELHCWVFWFPEGVAWSRDRVQSGTGAQSSVSTKASSPVAAGG